MNRILGYYPLGTVAMTIIALSTICYTTLYVITHYKHNAITTYLNVLSGLATVTLVFHMLQEATFVHPMSGFYHNLLLFTASLLGLGFLLGIVISVFWMKRYRFFKPARNTTDALSRIEDVVFVIDRQGAITYVNHPQELKDFIGALTTMEELEAFLVQNGFHEKSDMRFKDLGASSLNYELVHKELGRNKTLSLCPIILKDKRLGYTAILEDVTAIRNSEALLQEQNEKLIWANGKLSSFIKAAGDLEAEKERLIIINKIQETLISDMEKAMQDINTIKSTDLEKGLYKSDLKGLAVKLRHIYQKVRSSVVQISGKERGYDTAGNGR